MRRKLMKTRFLLPLVFVALVAPSLAQQRPKQAPLCPVAEGGEPDDRASARVLYWDEKLNHSAGQLAIDYGRPVWQKKYADAATFDGMTKGKVWRMGSNFWTLLDTSLPLKISGKAISPGYYFLGLARSTDGAQWSLAFIDPAKVRSARGDAFEIQRVKVEFEAPVNVEKATSVVDKLTITFSYKQATSTKVTLRIAWGNFLVSAPVDVSVINQTSSAGRR
jgi:hypothetical protein